MQFIYIYIVIFLTSFSIKRVIKSITQQNRSSQFYFFTIRHAVGDAFRQQKASTDTAKFTTIYNYLQRTVGCVNKPHLLEIVFKNSGVLKFPFMHAQCAFFCYSLHVSSLLLLIIKSRILFIHIKLSLDLQHKSDLT